MLTSGRDTSTATLVGCDMSEKKLAKVLDGVTHYHSSAIKLHEKYSGCWECCDQCNYGTHTCHFCGTELNHDSTEYDDKRHWLSDCRPDLVEHEIGETCTWFYQRKTAEQFCYAFKDDSTQVWTDSHSHFMKDGPVV